ncbi:phospholipase DDHD2 isoform X4 [Agrilus planipennis]|uniref:Phospholipase DDHD2 isoform X3 n=1 Tax=Agrilus planipennis TaxID=224129 RepID=A0A1W4WFB0_AGRPL|nr:phospholipase DDHD2 isoform X3 [Agrilus planipennis]XP_025833577.1 phospholipase DDHD2 isoform X4 [Agrilus planipennis]
MSKNSNTTKKINNPLFSASVTGATVEDFTQNAKLLVAQEIPEKSDQSVHPTTISNQEAGQHSLHQSPQQKEGIIHKSKENIFSSFFSSSDTSANFLVANSAPSFTSPVSSDLFQSPANQPLPPPSITAASYKSSTVPSTPIQPLVSQTSQVPPTTLPHLFSNSPILHSGTTPTSLFTPGDAFSQSLAPASNPTLTQSTSSPALSHDSITPTVVSDTQSIPFYNPTQLENNHPTAQPVPLFPSGPTAEHPPFAGETSNSHRLTASKNAYRRTGLKRPTYAQIPGLLSNQLSTSPPEIFSPGLPVPHLPEPKNQELYPVGETPPLNVPQFSNAGNVSNDFQNINQNRANILTPSKSPLLESSLQLTSPVMSAMPFEELQQTQNIPFPSNPSQKHANISHNNTSFNPGYREVYHHWFYKRKVADDVIWTTFSMADSLKLEAVFTSHDISPDKVVATDGGRYDVNILRRERYAVYWESSPTEVRRCSWFFKRATETHFVPYEENIATMLEEEYKTAYESNSWNKKVNLPNGDILVLHGPDMIVFLDPTQPSDASNNIATQSKQKIVKRGLDEFDIDEGEPEEIDHLLFLVHGVGAACDLKFRSVEEVVEDFRCIALQLVRSHYRSSCERGLASRIELLPIRWHSQLHSDETGIDKKLKSITLDSIPRLRKFTNNTLLDILFYSSPIYCQTIISTVGNELNRLYDLFKQRNPSFNGGVSLGGHSLGSLILFDLLSHQYPDSEEETNSPKEVTTVLKPEVSQRKFNRRISYMMSAAGTGQPQLIYPRLSFQPKAFFALGSPIGMFVTVRGLDTLGEDFALPTCPAFFNIFHPYDPVAYRVESLINPQLSSLKPVLIPHHKGRKRMHLELKETMVRVGTDLKQKILDSMRSTIGSLLHFSYFSKREDENTLEAEVDKVIEEEITEKSNQVAYEEQSEDQNSTGLSLGILNKGRRIDYVLQEAPFEIFNDYIFALTSHVCYWNSEDTMLLILKEIYGSMNISTDSQIPQQTMTIERTTPQPQTQKAATVTNGNRSNPSPSAPIGMDPTAPIASNINIGPPPISGFVKKN